MPPAIPQAKTVRLVNSDWEYLDGGSGKHTLLIIPGGGGRATSMFSVNAALEPHCRVISLGIPTDAVTADQLIAGIEAICELLQVKQAVLLGHSFGGMVVQVFAPRYPDRVAGLVLSNTGFYLGARATILPAAARIMALAPDKLLKKMLSSQMNRLLKNVADSDLWAEFSRAELSQPDAGARIRGQLAILAQLSANPPHDECRIPVQIIASEDDRGFTKRETEFLKKLYPGARMIVFPLGTGHLSFLTRPAEYIGVIRQFLASLDD